MRTSRTSTTVTVTLVRETETEKGMTVVIADVIPGGEDLQPYTSDLESYGAPAAPLVTLPQSDR